jgi:hypothetical protein
LIELDLVAVGIFTRKKTSRVLLEFN